MKYVNQKSYLCWWISKAISFCHHIPTLVHENSHYTLYNEKCFNYIIGTDMEGNIRIYRLPKGRDTDQWKWYCSSLLGRTRRFGQYHFHWSVPRPKGSLSILILHSISVTIVCIALKTRIWHMQYKCIEIFN